MTWTALRWVWRLEAPLFVGMPPAGALNRCRLYVPARAIHGAITAELARTNGNGKSVFELYVEYGREVGLNCRFTYLYPSERKDDKLMVWIPKYVEGKGLQWTCCDDSKVPLPDRVFRRRLLHTRSATAIAPETDSAREGSLRETECINPLWDDSGRKQGKNVMLLTGYLFMKNNSFQRQLDNIDTLFIGGDTRYGLGKIRRIELNDLHDNQSVFEQSVNLDKDDPEIESDIVMGHLKNDNHKDQEIIGVKEHFGGWEMGIQSKGALTWAPGSSCTKSLKFLIDNDGYWYINS